MSETAVSEESSVIQTKRKPGRPRVLLEEVEAGLKRTGVFDHTRTRRGVLDMHYRMNAMGVLRDEPERFGWLHDHAVVMARGKHKASILSELGRIEDPEFMKKIADQICEMRPKARDAITMIRRVRIKRELPASANGLRDAIIKSINAYLEHRHGDDDKAAMIREAIDLVREQLLCC